jgi:4-oxalocrotonate tautomerase
MPLVEIHMATGRTDDQKRALLEAVTEAVHTALGAPMESIRVWIHEFEPSAYMAGGQLLSEKSR